MASAKQTRAAGEGKPSNDAKLTEADKRLIDFLVRKAVKTCT